MRSGTFLHWGAKKTGMADVDNAVMLADAKADLVDSVVVEGSHSQTIDSSLSPCLATKG